MYASNFITILSFKSDISDITAVKLQYKTYLHSKLVIKFRSFSLELALCRAIFPREDPPNSSGFRQCPGLYGARTCWFWTQPAHVQHWCTQRCDFQHCCDTLLDLPKIAASPMLPPSLVLPYFSGIYFSSQKILLTLHFYDIYYTLQKFKILKFYVVT